jgi:UPF0755 protein
VKRILLLLSLLIVVAAAAATFWFVRDLERPFKAYEGAEQFVVIPPGSSQAAMARRLKDAGVVRSEATFRAAVWMRGAGRRLQAGEYRFDRPMSAADVVEKIRRGDIFVQTVTFREGLTIRQMSELYESRGLGRAADFVAAARDAAPVEALDPEARDLEGYLFPDTYSLPRGTTAAQLVERMVAAFQKVLTVELREQAAARGLGVRELVTLASLVEKETARPEERPLVAAVYHNRLKIRMALYCDPTVIYALERAGRYTGNLTREDLQFDSPYNTYRYAGLPPGPIAAPGRASLEAAANPADASYLYFVSRNDGSHVFANTLDEHNRNVYEYQKKPFRNATGR